MKKVIFLIIMILSVVSVNAQYYKETFDSNSLQWTECAFSNDEGNSYIEEGALHLKSYCKTRLGMYNFYKEYTFFHTYCYAPIDPVKPFEIVSNVVVKSITKENEVGVVFNYRDQGNFYSFSFNKEYIIFTRYEDGEVVGYIKNGIKWKNRWNANMQWKLVYDGDQVIFEIDGVRIMSIRYMPLSYSGFGYYSYGDQSLYIQDVEFIQ